ncbi:hypothetical protein QJQ45_012510 [Haematococcus lacustris]|nr:hypothetical protein QJQ45_012510 [Haematococcus lacustris]
MSPRLWQSCLYFWVRAGLLHKCWFAALVKRGVKPGGPTELPGKQAASAGKRKRARDEEEDDDDDDEDDNRGSEVNVAPDAAPCGKQRPHPAAGARAQQWPAHLSMDTAGRLVDLQAYTRRPAHEPQLNSDIQLTYNMPRHLPPQLPGSQQRLPPLQAFPASQQYSQLQPTATATTQRAPGMANPRSLPAPSPLLTLAGPTRSNSSRPSGGPATNPGSRPAPQLTQPPQPSAPGLPSAAVTPRTGFHQLLAELAAAQAQGKGPQHLNRPRARQQDGAGELPLPGAAPEQAARLAAQAGGEVLLEGGPHQEVVEQAQTSLLSHGFPSAAGGGPAAPPALTPAAALANRPSNTSAPGSGGSAGGAPSSSPASGGTRRRPDLTLQIPNTGPELGTAGLFQATGGSRGTRPMPSHVELQAVLELSSLGGPQPFNLEDPPLSTSRRATQDAMNALVAPSPNAHTSFLGPLTMHGDDGAPSLPTFHPASFNHHHPGHCSSGGEALHGSSFGPASLGSSLALIDWQYYDAAAAGYDGQEMTEKLHALHTGLTPGPTHGHLPLSSPAAWEGREGREWNGSGWGRDRQGRKHAEWEGQGLAGMGPQGPSPRPRPAMDRSSPTKGGGSQGSDGTGGSSRGRGVDDSGRGVVGSRYWDEQGEGAGRRGAGPRQDLPPLHRHPSPQLPQLDAYMVPHMPHTRLRPPHPAQGRRSDSGGGEEVVAQGRQAGRQAWGVRPRSSTPVTPPPHTTLWPPSEQNLGGGVSGEEGVREAEGGPTDNDGLADCAENVQSMAGQYGPPPSDHDGSEGEGEEGEEDQQGSSPAHGQTGHLNDTWYFRQGQYNLGQQDAGCMEHDGQQYMYEEQQQQYIPNQQYALSHNRIVSRKPKLFAKATARLNAHSVMAKDPGKKQKASRSPQGKQRQERRDGWTTRRRQVVCRPRGTDQRRGRVVLVDEHRTSRVSSAVNGQQPCEEELDKLSATRPAGWKPPAGQVEPRLVQPAWSQERGQPVRGMMWCPVVPPRKPPQAPSQEAPSQEATPTAASEPGPSTPPPAKRTKSEPAAEPTKGKGKGKAAKAKPAPQPGRWLDRDCNAALNMQRIGESRWRPLELCYWPDQGALPAKSKEYPGLGYKRLRDKPPKAQQRQPAVAQ